MTVSIRRPIAERVDYTGVRLPQPTVFLAVRPFTIRVEIFATPNIVIKILPVITKSFREILLAIAHPIVIRIARNRTKQFPITGSVASDYQFC